MFRVQTAKPHLNKVVGVGNDENDKECENKILWYLKMMKDKAVGIAANQLFYNNRMFGIRYNDEIIVFKNPYVIGHDDIIKSVEGCMSIKDGKKKYAVLRHDKATVRSDNHEPMEFEDYMATVVQHEMDHLDGKLIQDVGKHVK